MRDQADLLKIKHEDKLKLLKTLLKDDFQTFLFVANMYISSNSLTPKEIERLCDGGLKRNYKFNKQQND
jgi:hypothetical protein